MFNTPMFNQGQGTPMPFQPSPTKGQGKGKGGKSNIDHQLGEQTPPQFNQLIQSLTNLALGNQQFTDFQAATHTRQAELATKIQQMELQAEKMRTEHAQALAAASERATTAAAQAGRARGERFVMGDTGTAPLEADLKKLFTKYVVDPQIEQFCIKKRVITCTQFYTVGHDKDNARAALATLGNLDLSSDGAVPVAALMGVWKELHDRYTDRADNPEESLSSYLTTQVQELLEKKFLTRLPPYRQPCGVSLQLVNKNYRGQKYEVVPIHKMRCKGMDDFDPLSHKNRAKHCDKRYYTGEDGKLHQEAEDDIELDLKSYRRAMDIYLWCEMSVGNLLNPAVEGGSDHMRLIDKLDYETMLQRFGFDPPPRVRMDLGLLKANEIKLRAHMFLLFADGHTWGSALAKLEVTNSYLPSSLIS